MIKQFDKKIYDKYVKQLTNTQFVNITVNLYINNKNTFKNFCIEADKVLNKTIKPIKQFDEQLKLKKSLYSEAKNIEDDVIRKKIFADLRDIQKKLDNKIDCVESLNAIQKNIKKEINK